jgi:formylglycine-generating enzyme required for sulfatase activity
MVGNVFGWTEDCPSNNYNGAPTDGSAWIIDSNCKYRVVRGGSWFGSPVNLRSANRDWGTSGSRNNFLGFRLGRTLLTP